MPVVNIALLAKRSQTRVCPCSNSLHTSLYQETINSNKWNHVCDSPYCHQVEEHLQVWYLVYILKEMLVREKIPQPHCQVKCHSNTR